MRDYAKIAPQFWTGETGRRIRAAGRDAQIAALYLISAPSSTMLGIYYLPIPIIAHETGLSLPEVNAAIGGLSNAGFAYYDHEGELVWIPNMASYQMGEALQLKDNRRKWIVKALAVFGNHPFVHDFFGKYARIFQLETPHWLDLSEGGRKGVGRGSQSGAGAGAGAGTGAGTEKSDLGNKTAQVSQPLQVSKEEKDQANPSLDPSIGPEPAIFQLKGDGATLPPIRTPKNASPGPSRAARARDFWQPYFGHFYDRIKSAKSLDKYDMPKSHRGILAGLYDAYDPATIMACWDLWWMRDRPWSEYALSRGRSLEVFADEKTLAQLLDAPDRKGYEGKHRQNLGTDAAALAKKLRAEGLDVAKMVRKK